ncbi:hypothetical protein [Serratia sp. 1D1416]|uniref:hypothetical protein n=1 Tax=Serratia sp. 1D1416 TaxID=2447890 RepID=UPI001013C701|nr:hypothetical protein [Serratia sp. 1D1416]
MNISTEAGYARHANLLKIAAAIWLLAVSILAVINTVGLSRLDSLRQNAALDARLQALAERVEEVENHFRLFEARPTPAPSRNSLQYASLSRRKSRVLSKHLPTP